MEGAAVVGACGSVWFVVVTLAMVGDIVLGGGRNGRMLGFRISGAVSPF